MYLTASPKYDFEINLESKYQLKLTHKKFN